MDFFTLTGHSMNSYFSRFVENSAFCKMISQLDLSLLEVGFAPFPPWNPREVHNDPYFRLYYIRSGSGGILLDGMEYPLRENHLCLIPANRDFRYSGRNPAPPHFFAHFCSHRLEHLPIASRVSAYAVDCENEMRSLLEAVKEGGQAPNYRMNLEVRALLGLFLCREEPSSASAENIPEEFRKLEAYMRENSASPLSSVELAGMLCMNRNRFSREFRRFFGTGPREHLCRLRINHAKVLLMTTDLSTKAIAAESGYPDEFFFYRIFRKYVGLSPTAYRIRQKNRLPPNSGETE